MQIYLVRNGRRTTISVDDQLVSYLVERLGAKPLVMGTGEMAIFAFRDQKKERLKMARQWIQLRVDAAGDMLPPKGISQWVQARIVDAIADPALKTVEQVEAEAELNVRVQSLWAQRRQDWEAFDSERKRLVELRETFESKARSVAQRTPHYRAPPKRPT